MHRARICRDISLCEGRGMLDELNLPKKMHKVRNKEREFTMTNFHVEAEVSNNICFARTEIYRIMMVNIIHVGMLESLLKMAKLGRNMSINITF
jgi:hypothetical protein